MQDNSAKQQIVERIKNSTNILVTVGNSPSVDALSATLALTLMLNKLDKHATAVFSGAIPPAINFLEPNKTFENSVDSLRDFIIALDKDKADRLRYKVDNNDNVVRIFITPYRTNITEKDLQFSQGDFNVELIIALGVEKREDLDAAITAHGRILHDATVVTINAKDEKSDLGSIDWQDASASSLCEMLMSLSEALQTGLLDQQISTSLLTGLVSATERFSNTHTSPRVMTMAAQLMAAGANQQLIAAKLGDAGMAKNTTAPAKDGTTPLKEGASKKLTADSGTVKPDGEMHIDHQKSDSPKDPAQDSLQSALQNAQAATAPTLSVADLKKDLSDAANNLEASPKVDDSKTKDKNAKVSSITAKQSNWRESEAPPALGGTLNATTEEAEESKRREQASDRNRTILSHGGSSNSDVGDVSSLGQPYLNAHSPGANTDEQKKIDPFETLPPVVQNHSDDSSKDDSAQSSSPQVPSRTLADLEQEVKAHKTETTETTEPSVDDARQAVHAAFEQAPFDAANHPLQSVGAQPLSSETLHSSDEPQSLPPLPPLPDFSTLPPLPSQQVSDQVPASSSPTPPPADAPTLQDQPAPTPPAPSQPVENNPSQFRIPGQ